MHNARILHYILRTLSVLLATHYLAGIIDILKCGTLEEKNRSMCRIHAIIDIFGIIVLRTCLRQKGFPYVFIQICLGGVLLLHIVITVGLG